MTMYKGGRVLSRQEEDKELLKVGIMPGHIEREIHNKAISEAEELIIKHTELATGTKHIVVDGEDRYIPLAEAKKLGLL